MFPSQHFQEGMKIIRLANLPSYRTWESLSNFFKLIGSLTLSKVSLHLSVKQLGKSLRRRYLDRNYGLFDRSGLCNLNGQSDKFSCSWLVKRSIDKFSPGALGL